MRYIVVHGHFYQPPRENPWTERIDPELSARPFADWNDRIHRECYAPNQAVRIRDGKGRIEDLVSNYERLSFNFGPTLLDWMRRHRPETVEALREADKAARAREGEGNAIAQAYNHPILPLLGRRDKRTQVRWGLAHFSHVFGRPARGMWLPETAADPETLDVLAGEGVSFTVLAPRQAKSVRNGPDASWRPATGKGVIGRPFHCPTGPGRGISLFFYDGELAQGVAFGELLKSGEALAGAFRDAARGRPDEAPAVHVATDGETFGHHHRFSEMALAHAFRLLETEEDLRVLNYASLLEELPPREEVQITSAGSWSCSHGVERWRSDCGCSTGGEPGWNQAWRAPLREGLEYLQRGIDAAFEREGGQHFQDPWEARDAYIEVLLDATPESRRDFLARFGRRGNDERVAWSLLEAQRHTLLMFTSCGWFFSDLDGLEGRQVLRYAARALELIGPFVEPGLGGETRRILEGARSNAPPHRTGADLLRAASRAEEATGLAALAAETVLFEGGAPPGLLSPPPAVSVRVEPREGGTGRVEVEHRRTGVRRSFLFRKSPGRGLLPALRLQAEKGSPLPREEAGRVWTLYDIDPIVLPLCRAEWEHAWGVGNPEAGALVVHFAEFLERGDPGVLYESGPDRARTMLGQLEEWGEKDAVSWLAPALTVALERISSRLGEQDPTHPAPAASLLALLETARVLGLELDLWDAQTRFWHLGRNLPGKERERLARKLGFTPGAPGGGRGTRKEAGTRTGEEEE
jgi:alpha-amylase/alpha-mannosidase (GH57 family)